MTVESILRKVTYEGNGVAASFPVPFEFSQAADLRLVFTDAAGADTAVTSNFEVVVESGGTSVTYPVSGPPIVSGTRLTIFRDTPQTQIVALETGGAFDPGVLENDGFDRIVMMVQEVQEEVDRSVTVPISSDTSPDELMRNLFGAADSAADSAAQAAASADNARQSEQNAKASEILAAESRDWACQCADRAESARDVAMQQTETVNLLMETELAKINAIVGANRDDQQAAVEQARKWAEEEPGVPVAVDGDGNALFSARHWANEAEEINIPVATTKRAGIVRPDGVSITVDGEGIISGTSGYNILDLKWSTTGLVDEGFLDISRNNGLLLRSAYPQAWEKIQRALTANTGAVTDDAAWQTEFNTNGGVCGRFSTGDGSTTFRLPVIARRVSIGASESGVGQGNFKPDQMRPITGRIRFHNGRAYVGPAQPGGAFSSEEGTSSQGVSVVDSTATRAIGAVLNTAILGGNYNGDITHGPLVIMTPMMKMYGTVVEASEANIAELINQTGLVNGRVDSALQISQYASAEVEQIIGTWIDGKPFYRKVVNMGILPNTTEKLVAHNIVGLPPAGGIISASGMASDTGGNRIPLPFTYTALADQIGIWVTQTNVGVRAGLNRSGYSGFVILQYVKN